MAGPARPDRERPSVEVADILRDHTAGLRLSLDQARAARAIVACRTAALGGHLEACDQCGYSRPAYNSCRNRHCPKCQVLKQELWAEAQEANLLPTSYFHVVFTVPGELHALFRRGARVCLDLLFQAISETLTEVARRRLGARLGFTAVLHTWTQKLLFHPHVHCVVTGGGLSIEGSRWISGRPNFLLPVRVLRTVFRGKLLGKLEKALGAGDIDFPHDAGRALLKAAARRTWVVYAKKPLAGPHQVVRYVSRYTHRIAISNSRLLAYDGKQVTFSWRDRPDRNRRKRLRLTGEAFARRFLQHILPLGFVRIRHFGLLSNRTREKDLARSRALLGHDESAESRRIHSPEDWVSSYERIFGRDPLLCPECGQGRLTVRLAITARTVDRPRPPPPC